MVISDNPLMELLHCLGFALLGFISSFLFIINVGFIKGSVKKLTLIEEQISRNIVFTNGIAHENIEYEFQGYCTLEKKDMMVCRQECDLTQIKTFNGIQYIGFYKKTTRRLVIYMQLEMGSKLPSTIRLKNTKLFEWLHNEPILSLYPMALVPNLTLN